MERGRNGAGKGGVVSGKRTKKTREGRGNGCAKGRFAENWPAWRFFRETPFHGL